MFRLRDVPIQRKLRLVILATCTAALVVASGALFALQFFFFERDYKRDLLSAAAIIANMSTGAIDFGSEEAAVEILSALRAKPHIQGAAVILPDGKIFAKFGDVDLDRGIEDAQQDGFHSHGGDLDFSQPIVRNNERLGTLYLRSDYRSQLLKLHGLYASILVVVLALSFFVAVVISSKLEHVISDPIQKLADTARQIAERSDYAVRAPKGAQDEVGEFTDTFNSMLDQIQSRDQALQYEIAERKRAEQELQRVTGQLVDASRQAGMAEVATGVLHNVGNVLNSVNVSATLIADKLGASRAGNLVKAVELLRRNNGSLAEFLSEDPKGKVLPGYLADVSVHLAQEREEALTELQSLVKNIEHIKEIVAMQQSYAKVSGVLETLEAESLVEDSLRMNSGAFERHQITVIREFESVPPLLVDKHKALQILVNLVRNAKYAMDEANPPVKRLTMSIRRGEGNTVAIAIQDNGVGIHPDNLTRIFSHGFTTRKDGHGFGLHTSAIAAREMGGRLTAFSDGPGHGASFILEFPIAQTSGA